MSLKPYFQSGALPAEIAGRDNLHSLRKLIRFGSSVMMERKEQWDNKAHKTIKFGLVGTDCDLTNIDMFRGSIAISNFR